MKLSFASLAVVALATQSVAGDWLGRAGEYSTTPPFIMAQFRSSLEDMQAACSGLRCVSRSSFAGQNLSFVYHCFL